MLRKIVIKKKTDRRMAEWKSGPNMESMTPSPRASVNV